MVTGDPRELERRFAPSPFRNDPVRIPAILILVAASTVAVGALPDDAPRKAPAPRIVKTLAMDPESPREIVGWWSDGRSLIEVARDGRYRRWNHLDRFDRPSDLGRWHRENHAVFWLNSYLLPAPPPRRAALWLRDEVLLADVAGLKKPFSHSATPPRVPADDLIGRWSGPGGELRIDPDLTYTWIRGGTPDAPVVITRQRGRWRLLPDGRLLIEPFAVNQRPMIRVAILDGTNRIVELASDAGALRLQSPPPRPTANPGEAVHEPGEDSGARRPGTS